MRMCRGNVIYIDRNPNNPDEGWGWVELTAKDMERFGISSNYPSSRQVIKTKEVTTRIYKDSVPHTETITRTYRDFVNPPSRGKAGAKKFTLNINGELFTIRAQKSLTNQAVIAWVKTWQIENVRIITPGNRTHSLDGEKLANHAHFVYFIFNQDSNAIKIGKARDLIKRMMALQTSSPTELKLIKAIQLKSAKEAQDLEQSLHKQFSAIRLSGEWFKADAILFEYISQIVR